jgi:hypothetical protein
MGDAVYGLQCGGDGRWDGGHCTGSRTQSLIHLCVARGLLRLETVLANSLATLRAPSDEACRVLVGYQERLVADQAAGVVEGKLTSCGDMRGLDRGRVPRSRTTLLLEQYRGDKRKQVRRGPSGWDWAGLLEGWLMTNSTCITLSRCECSLLNRVNDMSWQHAVAASTGMHVWWMPGHMCPALRWGATIRLNGRRSPTRSSVCCMHHCRGILHDW